MNVQTRTDAALLDDDAFLGQFDLVVLTDVDAPTLVRFYDFGGRFRELTRRVAAPGERPHKAARQEALRGEFHWDGRLDLCGPARTRVHDVSFFHFYINAPVFRLTARRHSNKILTPAGGEPVTVPTKVSKPYVHFSAALQHTWANAPKRTLRKTPPGLWATLSQSPVCVRVRVAVTDQCVAL